MVSLFDRQSIGVVETASFFANGYDSSMGILVFHSIRKIAVFSTMSLILSNAIATNSSPLSAKTSKAISGYALEDIVSCSFMDRIPWRFKEAGRKTRLLINDQLRLSSETAEARWEIYQVMDKEGFVTFIFRRALPSGQWESIVTRDSDFSRVLSLAKGRKSVTERQNLKTLIDRPALTFENSKGSSLSLIPGSTGTSALSIQLSQAGGRMLPPLFIRGSTCARPIDEANDGATKEIKATATPKGGV